MKKMCWLLLLAVMVLPLAGGEIIFQSGFDSPEDFAKWRKVSGWSYSANGGRNGTGAGVLTRKGFSGPMTKVELTSLNPGVLYRLTVWVRPENLESDGKNRNYGGYCVEFVRDGKWVSGFYPQSSNKAGKWQKYTLEFIPKPKVDATTIVLYMRKGFKGTIYFDDITLEEAGDGKAAILVTAPSQLTFTETSGELKLSGTSSENVPKNMTVKISGNGSTFEAVLKETAAGEFVMPLAGLKNGEYTMTAVLKNAADNRIISKAERKFFVNTDVRQKSSFDAMGNLHVDGKKFLPIGIFGGFGGAADLKRISDTGFNTIMNYSSFGMTFGGNASTRRETMLKSLDVIRQHDLKLLFSLKDQYAGMRYAHTAIDDVSGLNETTVYTVNVLKNHPALLGWYTSDENSRSEMQQMIDLRQLISRNDPDHPTVTLTFREGDLPLYGAGGDVIAVDNYPIGKVSENKSLAELIKLIQAAKMGRQPVWLVPQIFNWGVYRAKSAEEFSQYAFPSCKEMKSMIAVGVILGCKGFIFYSYSDIAGERGRKFAADKETEQWQNVSACVAMLKKLESFILSSRAPEMLADSGKEMAVKLCDDHGKRVIIAVRSEAGNSKLVLPAGERYQLIDGSAEFVNGKWIFTGKDIDFCILQEI